MVPALAGCSDDVPETTQSNAGVEGVEPLQLGELTPGVQYPDPYLGPQARAIAPFGDGSKTFKVVVQQDAQVIGDWNTNEFTQWFAERTGVDVEFQAVLTTGSSGATDLTKINALLAAGDLPDAFLGIPLTDDQISVYGAQGIFTTLDDYIQTYAPQMRQAMVDYPDIRPLMTATDGHVYQFRGLNDCYHCHVSAGRAYVNQKYLDQVGAQIPTTTEELHQLLAAFKANDPTSSGNIIPFGASIANTVDRFVMNAFLYNPGGDTTGGWLAVADGTVEFVATKPEWRDALRYLRGLYDDGLIDRQTFTMTPDTMLQAGNQGRFGVVRAYFWGQFTDISYDQGAKWHDYVSLPPLTGPAGVRYSSWDYYAGYRGSAGLVVTSQCSDPATLVRWADAQMELEATVRAYGGREGSNWSWSDAGDSGISNQQAIYALETWPAPAKQSWNQSSVMYRSNDFRLGQYNDPGKPSLAGDMAAITPDYEAVKPPQELQLPH